MTEALTFSDGEAEAELPTWNCSGKGEHGLKGRCINGNTGVRNLLLLTQLHMSDGYWLSKSMLQERILFAFPAHFREEKPPEHVTICTQAKIH